MAKVNTVKDVPESEVDNRVAQYESFGYKVEKKKQPDGRWTIIATKTDDPGPTIDQ